MFGIRHLKKRVDLLEEIVRAHQKTLDIQSKINTEQRKTFENILKLIEKDHGRQNTSKSV